MSAKHLKPVTSFLPQDIIEIILLNLPAKSLLRFKTVSKSWYTAISDPVFVQNHLLQSKTSKSHNLFLCSLLNSSVDPFSLVKIVDDKRFQTLQVFKGGPRRGFNTVLCYCDGVLLLTDDDTRESPTEFVLWNPSTRTRTMFQFPYHDQINIDSDKCYGLCHDPRTGDIKVVVICSTYYTVYSCKNKAWTKKQEFGDTTFRVAQFNGGVFIDGVVYWLKLGNKCGYQLTYLDPRDDEFKMSHEEHEIFEVQNRISCITELEGRLCSYYRERRDYVHIWIKEKGVDNNSWKELITVENVETFIRYFEPVCFVENKVVIRLWNGSTIVVYNPFDKKFEEFDCSTHCLGFQSFPYLDSLLSFPLLNSV